jgi:hypothetical protein
MFKQYVKSLAKYIDIKVDDNSITFPHDHKIEFDKLKILVGGYPGCICQYICTEIDCINCRIKKCIIEMCEYNFNNIIELELRVKLHYSEKCINIKCTNIHPNVIKKYQETTIYDTVSTIYVNSIYIYDDLYEYTPYDGKYNGTYSLDNVKYKNYNEIKNIIIEQFNIVLSPELLNIILDYMLQDVKLMI